MQYGLIGTWMHSMLFIIMIVSRFVIVAATFLEAVEGDDVEKSKMKVIEIKAIEDAEKSSEDRATTIEKTARKSRREIKPKNKYDKNTVLGLLRNLHNHESIDKPALAYFYLYMFVTIMLPIIFISDFVKYDSECGELTKEIVPAEDSYDGKSHAKVAIIDGICRYFHNGTESWWISYDKHKNISDYSKINTFSASNGSFTPRFPGWLAQVLDLIWFFMQGVYSLSNLQVFLKYFVPETRILGVRTKVLENEDTLSKEVVPRDELDGALVVSVEEQSDSRRELRDVSSEREEERVSNAGITGSDSITGDEKKSCWQKYLPEFIACFFKSLTKEEIEAEVKKHNSPEYRHQWLPPLTIYRMLWLRHLKSLHPEAKSIEVPEYYLRAASELICYTLTVTNAYTMLQEIPKDLKMFKMNPLYARLGYNNFCVGMEQAPICLTCCYGSASRVLYWFVGIHDGFYDHRAVCELRQPPCASAAQTREDLTTSDEVVLRRERGAKIASKLFPLVYLITPFEYGLKGVWIHSMWFISLIISHIFVMVTNFLEAVEIPRTISAEERADFNTISGLIRQFGKRVPLVERDSEGNRKRINFAKAFWWLYVGVSIFLPIMYITNYIAYDIQVTELEKEGKLRIVEGIGHYKFEGNNSQLIRPWVTTYSAVGMFPRADDASKDENLIFHPPFHWLFTNIVDFLWFFLQFCYMRGLPGGHNLEGPRILAENTDVFEYDHADDHDVSAESSEVSGNNPEEIPLAEA